MPPIRDEMEALDPLTVVDEPPPGLTPVDALRLAARYGEGILPFAASCPPAERERIGDLPVHWLELRWAARHEAVVHLDDLLLRRVRLGLLLPDGGVSLLPRIRALVQPELGWDEPRWAREVEDYMQRWRYAYSLPDEARQQVRDRIVHE